MGMKIQKVNTPFVESSALVAKDGTEAMAANEVSFRAKLTDLQGSQYEKYIENLAGDIVKQGEIVAKHADLREFHKYRELIRRLVDETASNAFSFSKFRKFDGRGRNKTFAIIKRINEKLDEMTQELLKNETDHIALLRSVDDIRGMLLDMLM